MIKIGDQIVVSGIMPPAIVSNVRYIKEEDRYAIDLDWGDRGVSVVYDNDENKVWYTYTGSN